MRAARVITLCDKCLNTVTCVENDQAPPPSLDLLENVMSLGVGFTILLPERNPLLFYSQRGIGILYYSTPREESFTILLPERNRNPLLFYSQRGVLHYSTPRVVIQFLVSGRRVAALQRQQRVRHPHALPIIKKE